MNSFLTIFIVKAKRQLNSAHNTNADIFNSIIISNILDNDKTHLVSQFKDFLIYDDENEFLKRYYKRSECVTKLTHFFEFYELNSKIFPNYVSLFESKYLFKNIKKKQKMLDNLREIEENQNKTQTTHSDIFTSNAIGSICDELEEDRGGGIIHNSCNDRDVSVERLIDTINDYDKDKGNLDDLSYHDRVHKHGADPNHNYYKGKQIIKHHKKFIKEDESKSKSKSKKKINKERRSLSNISEKRIIYRVEEIINSNNRIEDNISSNHFLNPGKEDSKVVIIMNNEKTHLNNNKVRVATSTSNSKNKQMNIKTVKVNRGMKTTNVNKKYVQKINVFSDSEKQRSIQKNHPKNYQAALTEKNITQVNPMKKIHPKSNSNNSKNSTDIRQKESSNQKNKKEKVEAKSMPKLSTKGKLGLFPIGNRFKSSLNPQTARINIETKTKPIIIRETTLRGEKTNNKSQNQKKTQDQTTTLNNTSKTNQTQRIKSSLNNKPNSTEKIKPSSIIKAIPNLHINFFCQRNFASKSNEKSTEKANVVDVNSNAKVSNNKTGKVSSKRNDTVYLNTNSQTNAQYQPNNTKKSNNHHINEEHNIRAYIIHKEILSTNEESAKTERRNSKQTNSIHNTLMTTIKNSCLKSSQLSKQKPFESNNCSNQVIQKPTSVSVSSSHRLNQKQINSSINNSQKIASIEVNKVNGPLTTRTEHSNPPQGKTMPKETKVVIHLITKSNLVNNNIISTKSPTSPTLNRGGAIVNKQKPYPASLKGNLNTNMKPHNKGTTPKLKNFAEVVKDMNNLNKKMPLSSKTKIVNI